MASLINRRKSSVLSYPWSQYGDRCSWMRNEKFLRELQGDNLDEEVISEELRCLQDDEPTRCRGKTVKFLESNPWQVMMCALVLVDAIVVIVEILLELNAMRNQYSEATNGLLRAVVLLRDVYSTEKQQPFVAYKHTERHGNDDVTIVSRDNISGSGSGSGSNGVLTLIDSVAIIARQLAERMHIDLDRYTGLRAPPETVVSRDNRSQDGSGIESSHAEQMFQAAHVFHLCSLGILGIFVLQVLIKIHGMRLLFFKKKMELFDAIIIIASFALDLVFVDGITGVQGEETLVLIIIFLLWRVLRVINGLMVTAERRQEFRVKLQKRARRIAEKRIEYLEDEKNWKEVKNWKEREVINLRQLCSERGASEEQIAVCKPMRRSVYQKMDTSTGLSSIASLSLVVSMSMSGTGSRAILARSAAMLTPRHRRSSTEQRRPMVVMTTPPPSRRQRLPVVFHPVIVDIPTPNTSIRDLTSSSQYIPTEQRRTEVEIFVHRESDQAIVELVSEATESMFVTSRSDTALKSSVEMQCFNRSVAYGNGFIHTT